MITAVCKITNYGLTWTVYCFADHHTESLEIFKVNTWVNLEFYGTLVRGSKMAEHTVCSGVAVELTKFRIVYMAISKGRAVFKKSASPCAWRWRQVMGVSPCVAASTIYHALRFDSKLIDLCDAGAKTE